MINQFPEQIDSPHLVIRAARLGDGKEVNQAVVESLTELTPWLPWVTPTPSVADSEAACRKAYARFLLNEDFMVLFFLRETGELVGGSGLHHADWVLRQFEIGYWGRSRYCGKGLLTEGVRALAEYALGPLRASRVYLTTDVRNAKSCRLAERAGFELEGVLRNDRLDLRGLFRDTRLYSKVPLHPPTGSQSR